MRLLIFVVTLCLTCPTMAANKQPPNLVLMFIDNVGYGDLGCYGNSQMKTPNIDWLASQGVLCSDFYIGSPSCMPSRGALLTGRHAALRRRHPRSMHCPLAAAAAQRDRLPGTTVVARLLTHGNCGCRRNTAIRPNLGWPRSNSIPGRRNRITARNALLSLRFIERPKTRQIQALSSQTTVAMGIV